MNHTHKRHRTSCVHLVNGMQCKNLLTNIFFGSLSQKLILLINVGCLELSGIKDDCKIGFGNELLSAVGDEIIC